MTLLLFAFLAGAVQMVAPDRWAPGSILAWQKSWGTVRIAAFSIVIFALHVALGYGLYELFLYLPFDVLGGIHDDSLAAFTLLFLGIVGLARMYRFSKIREDLYHAPHSRRTLYTVISLLGPSEMVIPVLYKARLDGMPPLPMLLSLLAGTCAVGFVILMIARAYLNRPFVLPQMLDWCQSRRAALPMAFGTVAGIILLVTLRG
jgi:hypothetical protein